MASHSAFDGSCASTKSYGSLQTAESRDEPLARIKEIRKSAGDTKSYDSACTAECEEELIARISKINQESPLETLPTMGPSPGHQQLQMSTPSVLVPVSSFMVMCPVQQLCNGQDRCPCIDLEGSTPKVESALPARKRGGTQFAGGPSQKKQQKQGGQNSTEIVTGTQLESDETENVPESVWQQRIKKRKDAISNQHSNPVYYQNQDKFEGTGRLSIPRPVSPDVYDRTLRKRMWEDGVSKWRAEWREVDGVCYLMTKTRRMEFACRKAWKQAVRSVTEEMKHKKNVTGEKEVVPQERLHQLHKDRAEKIICR